MRVNFITKRYLQRIIRHHKSLNFVKTSLGIVYIPNKLITFACVFFIVLD